MENGIEFENLCRRNPIFEGLSKKQVSELLSMAEKRFYPVGETFIQENDPGNEFMLIISGKVSVFRTEKYSNRIYQIASLSSSDSVGEMAFLDRSPRSASVRAETDLHVFVFNIKKLETELKDPHIKYIIRANIGSNLSKRMRQTNDIVVKSLRSELKQQHALVEQGRYLVMLILMLTLYALSMKILFDSPLEIIFSRFREAVSALTILLLAIGAAWFIKLSSYPLKDFGLQFHHFRKDAIEGLIYSIPVAIVVVGLKWWLIRADLITMNTPLYLFKIQKVFASPKEIPHFFYHLTIYTIMVPLQEFVARGCLQASMQRLLGVETCTKKWIVLILPNLIFATAHTHLPVQFAIVTFLVGLLWSYLYLKQNSLVGCTISHWVLGIGGLFVLGLSL